MRKNQVMSALVLATVATSLVLTLAGSTQSQEKSKQVQEKSQQVTASLTVLCVGGCNDRGEKASMEDGTFCCTRDQSKLQGAFNGVKGVLKVAMKKDTRKVTIDYLPGQLNLNAVVKAGFDIIL